MDPATKELNYTFDSLKQELSEFKSEQCKLKFRISSLIDENRRLTNELKENIQIRLSELPADSDAGRLERKLQAALASKNAALEMWQSALQELEKQEELLIGKKSLVESEMKEVDKRIDIVKMDYMKGLNVLSEELSDVRTELCRVKKDLKNKSAELDECKIASRQSSDELKERRKEFESFSTEKKEMNEKISSLESLLSDVEKVLSENKEEMERMHSSKKELELSNAELKVQNGLLKSQILTFEKDAKDSLFTAQEAILQKKEIVYKEEQALRQIQEMKSTVNLEVEKTSFKFKTEMKRVEKQSAVKVHSLMEEINALHKESEERQSLFERAGREKQALESKLALLMDESGSCVTDNVFSDLCHRLTMAEKARDEYELRVQSLESSLKEMQTSNEQEVQHVQGERNGLREQLRKLAADFEEVSADRIKLSDEVAKVKKRCSELDKEVKANRQRLKAELLQLEGQLCSKQQECDEHLQMNEDYYRKMYSELQNLLNAEFKISNKWRDTVQELTLKSEQKIFELSESLQILKIHNEELTKALHKNRTL